MINRTLEKPPEPPDTEAPAAVVAGRLTEHTAEPESVRAVDLGIGPGVVTDAGQGDRWPLVHGRLPDTEIVIIASPVRPGRPSSVARRVPGRGDAMPSGTDDEDRPVVRNRAAGVVVTGNGDVPHHVVGEIGGALAGIGCAVPGQAWTYWRPGPGPGPGRPDERRGHECSTGRATAGTLHGVARAPAAVPVGAPGRQGRP